jgi:hypothetical protein
MTEDHEEFFPPNRVVGPILSREHAEHVRVRLAAILLLRGAEFLALRHILRDDLDALIVWEEEQA